MLPTLPMFQVPSLPHLSYGSLVDRQGQLWLFFSCAACGDQTQKPCGDPNRRTHWLQVYARLHAHPVQPRPQPQPYLGPDDDGDDFMLMYGAPPPPGMWRR